MKSFKFLIILLFLSINSFAQTSTGWQTIYESNIGKIDMMVTINDPNAKKLMWHSGVYFRTNIPYSLLIEINCKEITAGFDNGKPRYNDYLQGTVFTKANNWRESDVLTSDVRSFKGAYIKYLEIDNQVLFRNGQEISQFYYNTNGSNNSSSTNQNGNNTSNNNYKDFTDLVAEHNRVCQELMNTANNAGKNSSMLTRYCQQGGNVNDSPSNRTRLKNEINEMNNEIHTLKYSNNSSSSGTSSMNRGGNVVTGNSTNTNSEGTGWNGNNGDSNILLQRQQELAKKEQQFVDKYNEGVRLGNSGNYQEASVKYQEAMNLAINEIDRKKAQDAYNSVLKTNRTITTINTVGNVVGDVLGDAVDTWQQKLEKKAEDAKKQLEEAKLELRKREDKDKYYKEINNLFKNNPIYKYAVIDLIINELYSSGISFQIKDDFIKIKNDYFLESNYDQTTKKIIEKKENYEGYELNLNNEIKFSFITKISEYFNLQFYFKNKETVNKILSSNYLFSQLLKGNGNEVEDYNKNKFFYYNINLIDLITSENYSKIINNLQQNNLNCPINKIKYLGIQNTIQKYEQGLKNKSNNITSKANKSKEDYFFLAKDYYSFIGDHFNQYKNFQLAYINMEKNDESLSEVIISLLNNNLDNYYKSEINQKNLNEYIGMQIYDFSNILKNEISIDILDKYYLNKGKEFREKYLERIIKYFYEKKDVIINDKELIEKLSEIEYINNSNDIFKFKLYKFFGDIAYEGINDSKIDWGKSIENYITYFNNKGYDFSPTSSKSEAITVCLKISNMYETGGPNLEPNKKLSKEWYKKSKEFN